MVVVVVIVAVMAGEVASREVGVDVDVAKRRLSVTAVTAELVVRIPGEWEEVTVVTDKRERTAVVIREVAEDPATETLLEYD